MAEAAAHPRAPEPAPSSSIFILDTGAGADSVAVSEALQHALRVPILVESKSLPLDSNRNPVLVDESTAGSAGGGRFSLTTVLARIASDESPRAAVDLMTVTYQQAQQLLEQSEDSGEVPGDASAAISGFLE